jgi:hypothetical protein
MAVGSNTSGMRAQMGIAFDIEVPAGRAPDDERGCENGCNNPKRPLAAAPEPHGNAGDEKGGDQDARRNVPKGHAGIMARSIVNFKVPSWR